MSVQCTHPALSRYDVKNGEALSMVNNELYISTGKSIQIVNNRQYKTLFILPNEVTWQAAL